MQVRSLQQIPQQIWSQHFLLQQMLHSAAFIAVLQQIKQGNGLATNAACNSIFRQLYEYNRKMH